MAALASGPAFAAEPDEPAATDDEPAAADDGETETGTEEPVFVSDLDSLVRVVQQRPVLKSGRFELFIGAGIVANDTMYDHWLATGTGRVHVSEWISIGATYAKFFSEESELQATIANDYEVFPELSATRWYAGG
ncbi:MAG TPA: hypothetical protein PK095_15620, partial [Myxococcota bacterium]|nr:hypothetical protein [Myxococcota bacterium]